MSSVIFSLSAIGVGETAAASVLAYQPDINGAWEFVEEISLTIPIDPDPDNFIIVNPENADEYIWDCDLIDDTKDLLLATKSVSDVIRMDGIAPVPGKVAATLTTMYLQTKDLLMAVDIGTKLTAKLIGSDVVLGGALISRAEKTFESDANGISFTVGRGAKVSVEFPPFGVKKFDTTGKDSINMATGATI